MCDGRGLSVHTASGNFLSGKSVLITAGPTQEAVDPVRYLSNHSSGKTGYALARCAAKAGASVYLVSGPVSLDVPEDVQVISVKSAREMLEACEKLFDHVDIAIFTAAVCDYRAKEVANHKIKKNPDVEGADCNDGTMLLELIENPDIIASLAARKKSQIVVGFAAETENLIENAMDKLQRKNADFIVANLVGEGRLGFGTDTNEVYFIDKKGINALGVMRKDEIALRILQRCVACDI